MPNIQSAYTELPSNCKAAADHMAKAIMEEDQFADLTEHCQEKLTELEQVISKETGERIALVAYRV